MKIPVTIIGVSSSREIEAIKGDTPGHIISLKPVEGSDRAFLDLELPNKFVFQVETTNTDILDEILKCET